MKKIPEHDGNYQTIKNKLITPPYNSQECIPVGCIPSAAVAVGGGRGVLPGGVCPGVCLPMH